MFLFPPLQFLLFSLLNVIYPPPPPPPPHLLYIFFHPQIHRLPIYPTSTPHRPYTQLFFNTASWIVKLYTTTATTFLLFSSTTTATATFVLFSLQHHISIVFSTPSHFYCFPSTTTATATFLLFPPWVWPFRPDFSLFGLLRENNGNMAVVVVVVDRKQ